jgi:hypothetical protein
MSEPATLVETFTGLYGAFPSFRKHITFFHPKDARINSRDSFLTNSGKFIRVRVYNSLVEWENEDNKKFAYRYCEYVAPNGEHVMGHISEKVIINGGDPKENKGHSETTKNWEDFVRDGKNDTYEEFTSFGCVLRSSRHEKAVTDKTRANEILTAIDADTLIGDRIITPFGETLSKTQLRKFPILIDNNGDKKEIDTRNLVLKSKFPDADFITGNDILTRDIKHIVSSNIQYDIQNDNQIEQLKKIHVTPPPVC